MSRDVRWWEQAACKAVDPAVMHPKPRDRAAELRAQGWCRICPVTQQCLAEALDLGDTDGMRGGLTGEERQRLIDDLRPVGVCPVCRRADVPFTAAGLARHWRPGEGPAAGRRTCPGTGWVG